jgi:hypothetical protein
MSRRDALRAVSRGLAAESVWGTSLTPGTENRPAVCSKSLSSFQDLPVMVDNVLTGDKAPGRTTFCGTSVKGPGAMKRLCVKEDPPSAPIRVVGRRRIAHLLAAAGAVFAVLAPAAPAGAGGSGNEPPQPRPARLWKAYPLDAPRGGAAQPRAHVRSSKPGAAPRSSESGERPSLLLWISLAAFAAAVLAIVISWRAHLAWVRGGVKRGRQRAARLMARPQSDLTLAARAAPTGRPQGRLHALTDALHSRVPTRTWLHEVDGHAAPSARQVGPVDRDATQERALLKRKQAAATSESVKKLKEKKPAETRERYKGHEIGVLKAKLADRPPARSAQKGER